MFFEGPSHSRWRRVAINAFLLETGPDAPELCEEYMPPQTQAVASNPNRPSNSMYVFVVVS